MKQSGREELTNLSEGVCGTSQAALGAPADRSTIENGGVCGTWAQVKSYLAGNPGITLALNDSLVIGRREGGANDYGGYGRGADVVMLDDCNFHQSVSLDRHRGPSQLPEPLLTTGSQSPPCSFQTASSGVSIQHTVQHYQLHIRGTSYSERSCSKTEAISRIKENVMHATLNGYWDRCMLSQLVLTACWCCTTHQQSRAAVGGKVSRLQSADLKASGRCNWCPRMGSLR